MVSAVEEATKSAETSSTKTEDAVAALEEQFKDRYTENDPDYKAALEAKEASPPVIPNFGYGSSSDHRSSERSSRTSESSSKRSRSRSRSPTVSTKRVGMYDCQSYFVFYY